MSKLARAKKGRTVAPQLNRLPNSLSPEANEVRALLRRIPDGLKAALKNLAGREPAERERVLTELTRTLGKETLPLLKTAALGADDCVASTAIRVLPVLGTRAAGDLLVEVHNQHPSRARQAWQSSLALQARGISISLPEPEDAVSSPKLVLRETLVSAPDGVGSRSVAARLQDNYGMWHAVFVLWNDQAGVKDGFKRAMSRHEWEERLNRDRSRHCPLVACPTEYAQWQVAQARELNAKTGLPLDDHLNAFDEILGAPPEGYEAPDPLAALEGLDAKAVSALLEEGIQLFSGPEVGIWFLEAADCAEWSQKWIELQRKYRGQKDDEAREVIGQLVTEATGDLITTQLRGLFRNRLADLARVALWRGDKETAARAAATIKAIDGRKTPGKIPFFTALTERSLLTTYEMIQRGQDLERARYKPMKRY